MPYVRRVHPGLVHTCLPLANLPLLLQDGDSFMRIPEVYVKGNNVRHPSILRLRDSHG